MNREKFNLEAALNALPDNTILPCKLCDRELDYTVQIAQLCSNCSQSYCKNCWTGDNKPEYCAKCGMARSRVIECAVDKGMAKTTEVLISRARAAVYDVKEGKTRVSAFIYFTYLLNCSNRHPRCWAGRDLRGLCQDDQQVAHADQAA